MFIKKIKDNFQIVIEKLFFLFPMKKNRLLFFSHGGKAYSCNPKYICEELLKFNNFEIIWAFIDRKRDNGLDNSRIKTISYKSISRLYYSATSKVVITNSFYFAKMPIRKGQIHINTWHGGGCYKKIGKNDHANVQDASNSNTTHFISTSKYFTDYVLVNDFRYKGEVLEFGFPRNDIFFKQAEFDFIRKKIRLLYNVSDNNDIVLYAPTWRDDKDWVLDIPDFELVKRAYRKRFGKDCIVFIRTHAYTLDNIVSNNTVDVKDYPDMQELLVAADMLISDYSSCIWDYSFTYRPCLLYTPDLNKYYDKRGFDIDIYDWGFPVCNSNEQLFNSIINFDKYSFEERMTYHHDRLCSFEDGHASERMANFIYRVCFE